MKLIHVYIILFFLFFSLNKSFIKDAKSEIYQKYKADKLRSRVMEFEINWYLSRQKAMEDELNWSVSRQKAMDEEINRYFAREQAIEDELNKYAARQNQSKEELKEYFVREKTLDDKSTQYTSLDDSREQNVNSGLNNISTYPVVASQETSAQKAVFVSVKSGLKEKVPFFYDPVSKNFNRLNINKKDDNAINIFSFKNTGNSLEFNFESADEKRKTVSSVLPERRKRLLLEESLNTGFTASIYHPNLAAFDIELENGLRQSSERFQPNLTGKMENGYLNQFHILSSFLRKKPYGFSLLADKSRQIDNREFFERQVINSNSYGGNFGFKNNFVPLNLAINNSSRVIDRVSSSSQNLNDTELDLSLNNDSEAVGVTRFEASQNKFSRTESGVSDQKGSTWDFNLSNKKTLLQDEKKLLNSSLRYYNLSGTSESGLFNLAENLDIEHTDYLNTSYKYNLSDMSSAGVKTKNNRGSVSLEHKLYESLVSTLSPHYFNSQGSDFSENAYGLSWNEDYNKNLGKIGRLNLGMGLDYSEEEKKAPNSVLSVIGESHTLTTGSITFLNQLRVNISTVVIMNSAGTAVYIINIDYRLNSLGERTQIQRLPGGSIIDGQEVLVNYQASSAPFLVFSSLENNFRARIDFLDRLIGVYYRLNKNSYPRKPNEEGLVLQTLSDTTKGMDFNYKNLRLELEHEEFDSNLSPYKRLLFRESFFINPSEKSTLTFQSSQSIVRLAQTQDQQKFFDYLSRYSLGLSNYSRCNFEAGIRRQSGIGVNLDELAAGAGYELNIGKFTMSAKYDFRRQFYSDSKIINHFFYLKTKREF